MEMRHLRYVVALAEHATFHRAAHALGIAQPPLSRQIHALEREVGCGLFVRSSRGVTLTPAGRAFLDQARVTLAEAQRAVDRARSAGPGGADHLVVACEPAAHLTFVGRALARLVRSHPTLRVELREETPDATMRAVRTGAVQAAAVALPLAVSDEQIVVERIASVPLCLAAPVGHRLAGPRPVSWRRLADTPFVPIARDAAPVLYDAIATTVREQNLTLRARHRASTLAAALTLVAADLGVTILPSGWQPPRALAVICRPLRPPVATIPFGVAYRRDAYGSAVRRFVEAARAVTAPTSSAASRARSKPAPTDVAS